MDSLANAQDNIALEITIRDFDGADITPLLWGAADNIRCIRCDPFDHAVPAMWRRLTAARLSAD